MKNLLLHQAGNLRVGVECVIKYENKVLIQKRSSKSELFPNLHCFPGGNVDHKETPLDSVIREIWEECGIDINNKKLKLNNIFVSDNKVNGNIWIVFSYIITFDEEPKIVSSEEGECFWVEQSKITDLNLLPRIEKTLEEQISINEDISYRFVELVY